MAIAASTLDSLLDFMAGGILWFTHLSMKRVNIKYPIGKLHVQPIGIIVFAAIMATLGVPSLLWLSRAPPLTPCQQMLSHLLSVKTNTIRKCL